LKQCMVITADDGRYGFGLAGLEQRVADADSVLSVLHEVLAGGRHGLVFVDERLLQTVEAGQLRNLENRWQAVIVTLPAPHKGEMVEDYALQLIRSAVGYHVRLHL